jgi:DNA-binding NtrC family response regulator
VIHALQNALLLGQALQDNPNILIVEDEMLIMHLMESSLEEGGFKVILAASGEQAIQILDAQNPPFRAVITDVNLGREKSGWDVAKHAREIDPEIAIIYVTGHGGVDWTSHGLPKSILITKPFAVAQLLTAVESAQWQPPAGLARQLKGEMAELISRGDRQDNAYNKRDEAVFTFNPIGSVPVDRFRIGSKDLCASRPMRQN